MFNVGSARGFAFFLEERERGEISEIIWINMKAGGSGLIANHIIYIKQAY